MHTNETTQAQPEQPQEGQTGRGDLADFVARGEAAQHAVNEAIAAVNVGEPALDDDAVKARLAAKTAPRVTEDTIKARIRSVDYLVHGISTICVIEMVTGFKVFGHATPASPENFDPQLGEHYAYKNAFSQLWPLEGYLLRDSLAWQEAAAAEAAVTWDEGNPNTTAQPRG